MFKKLVNTVLSKATAQEFSPIYALCVSVRCEGLEKYKM